MTTPTSTLVVILATADGQLLPRCLEGVSAALGPRDRAVVVADLPERAQRHLSGQRRIAVEPVPEDGLAPAIAGWLGDHDVIVVMADDAVAAHRSWLAELTTAACEHPGCVVGPLTNGAPWPQSPQDPPDADAPHKDVADVARHCARDQRGLTATIDHLAGPVAAFERSALANLGPSGAGDVPALLRDLVASGVGCVVAQGVYVHCSATVPLVSGCLIVKDEAADLAECLATIAPLVDEVVVYDTGSTDDSVAIARAAGAIVINGEWHDDFARARNEAMARARGTWVLSIDADERLETTSTAVANLRTLLAQAPAVDRYIIPLYDLLGSAHAPVRSADGKPMARLFRRRRCHWEGAIHEQPNARPRQPAARNEWFEGIHFLHRGYLDEIVAQKNKWARNLRVAASNMATVPDDAKGCFDLARSMQSMGYRMEALTLFDRAVELDDNEVITRAALQFEVQALLEIGNHEDAESAIAHLRRISATDGVARYLEGWLRVEQGRWAEAVSALDGLTDYNDTFTSYTEDRRLGALALALRGAGDAVGAAHAAFGALVANSQSVHGWTVLLDTAEAAPELLRQLAQTIPTDRLLPTFLTLQNFPLSARDGLAEEIWRARPGDMTALAVASQFAAGLPVERLAVWSARLRAHGLTSLCPVERVAADGTRTVDERVAVLAAAIQETDDDRLRSELEQLVPLLIDDAVGQLARTILDTAIGAAECFIVAAATSASRSLSLVSPLVDHGHLGEALAVVDHASGLDMAAAQRWLGAHPGIGDSLRAAARDLGRDDLYPVLDQAA